MDNYTLVFACFIFIYFLVIWKGGRIYPILYLFLFTYFLQYIFSSFLVYNEYPRLSVQMAIKQSPYFDYVIPALISLFSGLFLFNKDVKVSHLFSRIEPMEANRLGYLLLFISFFFDALSYAGISTMDSIISFTKYFKYVAVFCFLFTNYTFNYILSLIIYVQLALTILRGGVFIDFIIWSTYLFFFMALKFRWSFLLRAFFIVIAMPILFAIQGVKDEYRKATWKKQQEGSVDLFTKLALKQNQESGDDPFAKTEGVVNTVSRLNEGWHLGLTMRQVPQKTPFADGREMADDIVSSIVPRIIFPEKKVIHSREKFRLYTGRKLKRTSMTIGLLGDFYINFGRTGSFIMLFIFGAIIAKAVHFFLKRFVLSDPINIIWVPFMLSYLIRADNDFYTIFNCLTKGFIIFLFVNYIRYRWLSAEKPFASVPQRSAHT